MKNLKSIITVLLAVFSTCIFAQTTANNGIREAAIKGKSDLAKILSENKEFNFGVSAREVEASQITNPIESFYTNFERLLNDNSGNINSISGSDQKFIVPFSIDNQVITTISVVSDSKGTKAVELVNQQYKTELNQLPAEIRRANYRGLKFIRVPNIEASLYIFEDKCYTSYKGGNLREGISISEMTRKLQIDAREFQTKFGEELKRGKLVR
ncbi:hypothetical protein NAT51_01230 [Flavobacterium amniphilum]|uniref:hypothetical protein n=1 Tax=Flavobacterium amniphilum TaxID=1834035 RepID=UPI00202AB179|nr:hypothetical protein [Flavobacterium amniphilum]MCL9804127.1 hypothetical protein [Flavobacterium amniphilum]